MKNRSLFLIFLLIDVLVIVPIVLFFVFPYRFRTPPPQVWYDVHGTAIAWYKQESWTWIKQVPDTVKNLVVGIEDRRFWEHWWIDLRAVARAIWANTQHIWGLQGASTIDQQLIKLDRQYFVRNRPTKLAEYRRAVRLQRQLSKEELLVRYLNMIPFSHGIRWRKSACQLYRWVPCDELREDQLLVMLMIAQLGANPYREDDRQTIIDRAEMYVRVRPDLFSSGLVIDSALLVDELNWFPAPLDPRVEQVVRHESAWGVVAYDLEISDRIAVLLDATRLQRKQYAIADCCVVVLDGQGGLVSMNMCRAWDDSQAGKTNVCLTPRQTWSAIKPFLYLYAFRKLGLTSADTIVDEPVQFDLGGGNIYDPKNFDLDYHGEVSYAYALGNSLNVPAVKTLHAVGVAPFLQFLKEQVRRLAPWTDENPKTAGEVWLSLALGTYELSPWQFTQLRRMLLPTVVPRDYLAQRADIVDVLSNPVNKVVSFWQDSFLATQWRAMKTGTSRKFVDGWICGVRTTVPAKGGATICIRLGNVTNAPMLGASSEVGSYLWSLVVQAVEKN